MSVTPLISVIIPAYNREQFVNKAIDSILAQTFKNWELLVVDDGSMDETASIVDDYCSRHPNSHYHYQPNQGVSVARNTGIEKATGQYVCFLDSDDTYDPEFLATTYVAAIEHGCDVVMAAFSQRQSSPVQSSPVQSK